ncbi:hypothetical protein S40293_06782 [Stachybotrys chartarum IBT 40293]|nr:hypothetical protein S40293_06782 [Stachybotrys chartarum IBT 40293]
MLRTSHPLLLGISLLSLLCRASEGEPHELLRRGGTGRTLRDITGRAHDMALVEESSGKTAGGTRANQPGFDDGMQLAYDSGLEVVQNDNQNIEGGLEVVVIHDHGGDCIGSKPHWAVAEVESQPFITENVSNEPRPDVDGIGEKPPFDPFALWALHDRTSKTRDFLPPPSPSLSQPFLRPQYDFAPVPEASTPSRNSLSGRRDSVAHLAPEACYPGLLPLPLEKPRSRPLPPPPQPLKRVRKQKRVERICGIRRKILTILFAVLILLVIAATVAGLAVGLHSRNRSGNSNDTPPEETDVADIACPGADGSDYHASGTDRYFRVQCGVDYNVGNGAVILDEVEAGSMAECIVECADREDCAGAGWGTRFGRPTCFMKSALGVLSDSRSLMFTVEVEKPRLS